MQIRNLTVAAVIVALSVAGCTTQTVEAPSESPTPSAAPPVFASEAEALEAARAAYARYLEVSDAIAADGGLNPERIQGLVSSAQFEAERKGASSYLVSGIRSIGSSRIKSFEPQIVDLSASAPTISVYACLDSTEVKILDSSGTDVTPDSRPDRQTLQVKFALASTETLTLLVDGVLPWSGASVC